MLIFIEVIKYAHKFKERHLMSWQHLFISLDIGFKGERGKEDVGKVNGNGENRTLARRREMSP